MNIYILNFEVYTGNVPVHIKNNIKQVFVMNPGAECESTKNNDVCES